MVALSFPTSTMAQVNPPAPPLLLTGEESPRHIPETDEDQNLLFKLMTSATSESLYRDPVAMYRWIFDEFLRLMVRSYVLPFPP